jgi:hypothetical protein
MSSSALALFAFLERITAERTKAQRRAKRIPPAIMAIVVMRTGDEGGVSEAFAAGSTEGKGLKGANGLKAVRGEVMLVV